MLNEISSLSLLNALKVFYCFHARVTMDLPRQRGNVATIFSRDTRSGR